MGVFSRRFFVRLHVPQRAELKHESEAAVFSRGLSRVDSTERREICSSPGHWQASVDISYFLLRAMAMISAFFACEFLRQLSRPGTERGRWLARSGPRLV